MGAIVTNGLGSGLDINGLVTQLVQAEGAPRQTSLARKESTLQARLSAFGSFRAAAEKFRSAVARLKDTSSFQARKATSGDTTLFTASAATTASEGSYAVEVVRLAQQHKLASAPVAASTTVVGTGTLTLTVGTTSANLVIDSSNQTLAGIRDAINGMTNNPGVQATIITATDGARLVLTATSTGSANAIKVTQTGGNGGLAALAYDPANSITALTQLQAAQSSRALINGYSVESATNTVSGALEGVTLTLAAASTPGETETLTVELDKAGTRSAVTDFVAAYNQLSASLKGAGAYDATTKRGGPLLGDSTLRDFSAAVRRELGSVAGKDGDTFRRLAEVGVTVQLDGTMAVDSTKLDAALANDFDAVGKVFASDGGYARRLDGLLERYVGTTGLIETRTQGLQSSLKDIDAQRTALQARLTGVEARLRKQYNALDGVLAQMKQTSNYLSQQLASLGR
ncbi:MAG: hypothetical protein RJB26_1701 [Pseudomonadota bacterium]|jgi:flagellar hook-associated protein 2